jgi:hypothetical protein
LGDHVAPVNDRHAANADNAGESLRRKAEDAEDGNGLLHAGKADRRGKAVRSRAITAGRRAHETGRREPRQLENGRRATGQRVCETEPNVDEQAVHHGELHDARQPR